MRNKNLFVVFVTLLVVIFTVSSSFSLVYIDINAPILKQLPLAITELVNLDGKEPDRSITQNIKTLTSDLENTGIFDILDPVAFLESPEKKGITLETIDFDDWTIVGAEGLVKGGYKIRDDNSIELEMRLFDTYQKQLIVGKRYVGGKDDVKRMMHRFANEILLKFTGERGIFGSKITYVEDIKSYKEIFVMDYDGSNNIQLTRDFSLNISPAWAPDGTKILYTSYKRGNPDLVVNDFAKGETTSISKRKGLNLGAEYSYDGKKIALTLSDGNNSNIYIIDAQDGKVIKRLTDYWGIDVSPSWSPDDTKIAFTSDRSGNPNIYVIDVDNSEAKRLSFNGKYNSSAEWSPKGDKIAFCGQDEKGLFNIYTINADGTGMERLTSGSKDNESPSWSPDGRQIAFASNRNGNYDIYVMNADGGSIRRLTFSKGNATSPSWSPKLE